MRPAVVHQAIGSLAALYHEMHEEMQQGAAHNEKLLRETIEMLNATRVELQAKDKKIAELTESVSDLEEMLGRDRNQIAKLQTELADAREENDILVRGGSDPDDVEPLRIKRDDDNTD